jgi:thioredoxin-dependent peroxiredoxin
MAMLKPGDAALDFVLKDQDGRDLRLSSFSGRPIVLFFYPKDLTPGCTIQAKGLRDLSEEFAKHNAVVVGVSLDPPDRHQEFQETCGLGFPLLSDPEGRVHDLYDAWRTTLLGRSSMAVRRCTFVIDADGIVRAVHAHVNVFTHAKAVLKDLERLKAQEAWPKPDERAEKERQHRKKMDPLPPSDELLKP